MHAQSTKYELINRSGGRLCITAPTGYFKRFAATSLAEYHDLVTRASHKPQKIKPSL